jgi:hypothetical protein
MSPRKRSVRFEAQKTTSSQLEQLDGQTKAASTPNSLSPESATSHHITTTSDRLEALAARLNLVPTTDTVVRRSESKKRPNVPFINTTFNSLNGHAAERDHAAPSMTSSTSPFSRGANDTWSPDGTASTAATSLTSPSSSASRKRTTPDDCQAQSKSGAAGEESLLPPIEEDSGRYLLIRVQENLVNVSPSVTTVENAAAAKCALETLYHDVFSLEALSPRSMRRSKFESRVNDVGMSHDDRLVA